MNAIVIRVEDLDSPRVNRCFAEAPIPWNHRDLAHRDDEIGGVRGAIAIDHESGVPLQDQGRVEPGGKLPRDPGRADVPGDVTFEIGAGQAERAQPGGKRTPGMLAGQEERRRSGGTHNLDRRRIAGAEQALADDDVTGLRCTHPSTPESNGRAQCSRRGRVAPTRRVASAKRRVETVDGGSPPASSNRVDTGR